MFSFNFVRKALTVSAALAAVPALTAVAARPAQAQTVPTLFSTRSYSGAGYQNTPIVSYVNDLTPSETSRSAYNVGTFGYGESHASVGFVSTYAYVSQPAGGPGVTYGGNNASGYGEFKDTLYVGGAPGTTVTLHFSIRLSGGAVSASNNMSTARAGFSAAGKSCGIYQNANAQWFGSSAFTVTVPAGSRIGISGNASASVSIPSYTGSRIEHTAQAGAAAEFHVDADVPVTSASGHNYAGGL